MFYIFCNPFLWRIFLKELSKTSQSLIRISIPSLNQTAFIIFNQVNLNFTDFKLKEWWECDTHVVNKKYLNRTTLLVQVKAKYIYFLITWMLESRTDSTASTCPVLSRHTIPHCAWHARQCVFCQMHWSFSASCHNILNIKVHTTHKFAFFDI